MLNLPLRLAATRRSRFDLRPDAGLHDPVYIPCLVPPTRAKMERSVTSHCLALLLAFLSTATEVAKPETRSSALYDLIGLSCGQPEGEIGLVAWRMEMPGIDRSASMRVFKHFQGRDTEQCLLTIIRTDPKLWTTFESLGPEPDEDFADFLAQVHRLWTHHGVADALQEVAILGRRGKAVDQLLKRCSEFDSFDTSGEAK